MTPLLQQAGKLQPFVAVPGRMTCWQAGSNGTYCFTPCNHAQLALDVCVCYLCMHHRSCRPAVVAQAGQLLPAAVTAKVTAAPACIEKIVQDWITAPSARALLPHAFLQACVCGTSWPAATSSRAPVPTSVWPGLLLLPALLLPCWARCGCGWWRRRWRRMRTWQVSRPALSIM